MKKLIALILVCMLCFAGCSNIQNNEKASFRNMTFNKAELSEETLKWLEWYNGLNEDEQLSISYIPSDLHKLCGYDNMEDAPAETE